MGKDNWQAGWLIRKLENWKISQTDEFLPLTTYRLLYDELTNS
jgi:hypothetical protein